MPTLLSCGATIADPGDEPGDLIVLPRQVEFGGLLLGAGTPYRWKELVGWDDMPGLDLSDAPRPNDHGDFAGTGLYQSRLPFLTLAVHGSTVEDTEELLRLLRTRMAYDDTETPLVIRDAAGTLQAAARVIARTIPHQPNRTMGVADAGVQWKCSSPLRTGMVTRTAHLTQGAGSGGLEYPLEYPLDYGTPAVGGSTTLVNDGEAPAPAVVTFHGPGNGYGIAAAGQLLKFNLPLADGDTLTVDTHSGTVLLNGSSDRTGWIAPESAPPETWRIPPGDTSVRFTVTDDAGPSTAVDIEWADSNW